MLAPPDGRATSSATRAGCWLHLRRRVPRAAPGRENGGPARAFGRPKRANRNPVARAARRADVRHRLAGDGAGDFVGVPAALEAVGAQLDSATLGLREEAFASIAAVVAERVGSFSCRHHAHVFLWRALPN